MLFSELYQVKRTSQDDWFDPILDHDTKLFIDPFLVFRKGKGVFADAHQRLIEFFNRAFTLAAESGAKRSHLSYKKLLNVLLFPEVDELVLGFAGADRGGAGTADKFGRQMAEAIMESIEMGLQNLTHFEELGIFNVGIAEDRISDITANVLKRALVTYTQEVSKRHRIPAKSVRLRQADFDLMHMQWDSATVLLPYNPYKEQGILLVPKVFLRRLPTIDPKGFLDYIWERKGDALRTDFNYTIKTNLDKEKIVAIARERRDWVEEFAQFVDKESEPTPYDLKSDPLGLYKWYAAAHAFVTGNPRAFVVRTKKDFGAFIKEVIRQFKHFVEQNAGYKLLWNEPKGRSAPRAKSEEAAQLLFLGIAKHYCRANHIEISREVDVGRGPVDFKFSSGFVGRALLEVKLAKSSRRWQGLEKQLPTYMSAEEVSQGHFVVVCYLDHDLKIKLAPIQKKLNAVRESTGFEIEATMIDARLDKLSGSKVK